MTRTEKVVYWLSVSGFIICCVAKVVVVGLMK